MAGTSARTRPIPSIVDRSDFTLLREHSSRSRSGPLTVRWVAATDGPAVAFAIGTKFGGAVKRNRLRRRIRAELARLERLEEVPEALLLISAQPAAGSLSTSGLRDHLQRSLDHVRRETGRSSGLPDG